MNCLMPNCLVGHKTTGNKISLIIFRLILPSTTTNDQKRGNWACRPAEIHRSNQFLLRLDEVNFAEEQSVMGGEGAGGDIEADSSDRLQSHTLRTPRFL